MAEEQDMLYRVQNYRKVVLLYEGLHGEINKLISANGGQSENMSPEDREKYRELARKRDEVMNEMRYLEQQLLDEDAL